MKQRLNNLAQERDVEGGRRPTGTSRSWAGTAAARSPGRPMKYRHLIENLEDDVLYSAGAIVLNAIAKGLLDEVPAEEMKQQKLRIRHTMCRFAKNHGFPKAGEGWVIIDGQAPTPGWRGATWKAALSP